MPTGQLNLSRNQLAYLGLFASPMWDWAEDFVAPGQALLQIFEPFGYGIDALNITTATQQLNQQSAQVFFGAQGNYLCKLDRCEANFFILNFQAQILAAKALGASDTALRETSQEWGIRSHQFTYTAHGELEARSVEETLGQFRIQAPKQGGVSKCTGGIFHWQVAEKGWETQLTLDESILVKGGLFLSLLIRTEKKLTDFTEVLKDGHVYLTVLLTHEPIQRHRAPFPLLRMPPITRLCVLNQA